MNKNLKIIAKKIFLQSDIIPNQNVIKILYNNITNLMKIISKLFIVTAIKLLNFLKRMHGWALDFTLWDIREQKLPANYQK
jgi:hypothetical protein